jgi:hypothetical protein
MRMDEDGGGFAFNPDEDNSDKSPGICTLDGRDFTCEVDDLSDSVEDLSSEGADVILTIKYDIGGRFSGDTKGSFFIAIDFTCEGLDCLESRITFPCTSALLWDIDVYVD